MHCTLPTDEVSKKVTSPFRSVYDLKGTRENLAVKEDPWQSGRQLQPSALWCDSDCRNLVRKYILIKVLWQIIILKM